MNGTVPANVASVADDVVIVSFHVGPGWVNLFVLRGGAVYAYRQGFEPNALLVPRDLTPTRTRGSWDDSLSIPDASPLVEPIANHLEGCSLIYLVPHGPLNHFPLHASFASGKRLIDIAPVVYVPALSTIPGARPVRGQEWRPLVFGNMTANLPGAEAEAEAVAYRLGVDPLVGRDATLGRLRDEISQANLLHIAGHGYFDPDVPLTSGIPFPDEILTVRHVYDLPLDDCVVVLSGCVTGLGEDRPGEGFSSLVGAFFAAGARALLVSLWEVDDLATTQFMVAFYDGVVSGASLPEAIQLSYHELRDEAERRNVETAPFYWAPFKPVGDW